MDLWWLQQNGYDSVGVECSEVAVQQFFDEQQLEYSKRQMNQHVSYKSDRLEILLGDFFTLQADDIGNISDIFDRASLIALPIEMRGEYVNKITDLQKTGTRTLLITLTYPQHEMDGPPFSVSEEEVNELYSDNFRIEKLAGKDILEDEPRFKQRGLTELTETAYKLTRYK
jgi:thiopurine S-methyltransferase